MTDDPGYRVLDFGDATHRVLRRLIAELEVMACCRLADYHRTVGPGEHIAMQSRMMAHLADSDVAGKIVRADGPMLEDLTGGPVRFQAAPYLRVSRPHEPDDNVGFHRDTWYGGAYDELSISIALTDTDDRSALCVRPGSHLVGDEDYPWASAPAQATRGDERHLLGFLYAPKVLRTRVEMLAVPLQAMQALAIRLPLLHGQEVNGAASTRVSMDFRIAPLSSVLSDQRQSRLTGNLSDGENQ